MSDNPTVHDLLSTRQQTDTVRDCLLNKREHLAAKSRYCISLKSWWRPNTELKERKYNLQALGAKKIINDRVPPFYSTMGPYFGKILYSSQWTETN